MSRSGIAQVGPLFPNGLTHNHTCTASVVASRSGDTILTAAHCLSGPVDRILFVPGYTGKKAPFGVWRVTAAYVTTDWLTHQTPADDFAVLTVANRDVDGRSVTLASVVGAERVGTTPRAGTSIRIAAYNNGKGDDSLTCATQLSKVRGHPTFFCHGFVGGSSGSPWLTGARSSPVVVGVIGGRHQGGCTEFVSHSPVFGSAVTALVARAARGGPADDPPAAGSDNCPADAA
ncbi:trypsin-like serine peptidase [uncultured Jatrophihabitans sp.]|uniref:trypsin-like serine peptidase n=1 Tax=uncultured Jatrophihabitans sp. TaxID=1610747 RepID=UPI0035CA2572